MARCVAKICADYTITHTGSAFEQPPVEAILPKDFFGRQAAKGKRYEEVRMLKASDVQP